MHMIHTSAKGKLSGKLTVVTQTDVCISPSNPPLSHSMLRGRAVHWCDACRGCCQQTATNPGSCGSHSRRRVASQNSCLCEREGWEWKLPLSLVWEYLLHSQQAQYLQQSTEQKVLHLEASKLMWFGECGAITRCVRVLHYVNTMIGYTFVPKPIHLQQPQLVTTLSGAAITSSSAVTLTFRWSYPRGWCSLPSQAKSAVLLQEPYPYSPGSGLLDVSIPAKRL